MGEATIGWDDLDSDDEVLGSDSNSSCSDSSGGPGRREPSEEKTERCAPLHCRLEDLVEGLGSTFPRAHALLAAHLQLDSLAARKGGRWTDVYEAVKSLCGTRQSTKRLAQGDVKTFKRLNVDPTLHPLYERTWAASVFRLQQRVSHLLATLREGSDSLRSYCDTLSSADRKAYNACKQVWRKSLRDTTTPAASSSSDHHLLTAMEASILYRQDTSAALVLCLEGGRGDRDEMKGLLCSIPPMAWNRLQLCADQSEELSFIVAVVMAENTKLTHLEINRHGIRGEESLGRTHISLSPSVLASETLTDVDNTFALEIDESTFSGSDFRQAVAVVRKTTGRIPSLAQAPKLASLATLSSLLIRKSQLDVEMLPPHLKEGVRTAVRCTSCARCMVKQRTKPRIAAPSLQFKKEATHAGFRVRRSVISEVIESLSEGEAYLPPLTETFELRKDTCRWGSKVTIGSLDPPGQESDEHSWQFCAACAAAHFKLGSPLEPHSCQCFVCRSERLTLEDPTHILKWRRHQLPDRQEYAHIMQIAGLSFG